MLYKDEAVVLRTMRLGEADRIITFLGRSEGKIRGVAKGIRKTKSRFGGRLEPFCRVSLVMWRGKSDLEIVTQAQVVEPYRAIREDLNRFSLGEVMLEASDRVVQEQENSDGLFRLLTGSLTSLVETPSPLVLAGFLLKLAEIAGFGPSLDRCAECAAPAASFSPSQGGAVCPACKGLDAEEVGPAVLELMSDAKRMNGSHRGPAGPEMVEMAARLSRFYAEYHLERRLKSAATASAMA